MPIQLTEEEFQHWLDSGMTKFTDDPNEITPALTKNATEEFRAKWSWPGPVDVGGWPGFALRPFHPKRLGHESMANAIIERLKNDFNPKNEPTPPPAPESPPPPPPPPPTKALSIILEYEVDKGGSANTFLFFGTDAGKSAVCRFSKEATQTSLVSTEQPGEVHNPPWPGGTYKMTLHGEDNCEYKSNGENAEASMPEHAK
ncbi:hypothetical protein BDV95DRAFT_601548 [Massariosphaeria phaeospora]|uniref:Uncharacterized protein n=1 Tax=Massariosphaeria phaeospora TaxID=100035 RepID=A0A7C8IDR2_9PLEO|nr:hypothetical protein BDV95DRAFT_601548 [Massariosphaeria phaeospora]